MKYLLKVKSAITLLPLLIAVSYLPTNAQNTAPVPTTFEILSPSDGNLPFLINHDYAGLYDTDAGGTIEQNTRIFYGGDFAPTYTVGAVNEASIAFVGWSGNLTEPLAGENLGRGNASLSRLTLGGTEQSDYQGTAGQSQSYVGNLPGVHTILGFDNTTWDADDIGDEWRGGAQAGTMPMYTGSNGFIAINEEDSLVIRLTGYVDPNNRFKTNTGGVADGVYDGGIFESEEYAFNIANPANDSQNGVRFGVLPSTLPAGASFNGAILSWVPTFRQGDGDYDNSVRNGKYFVDANISDGDTGSETDNDAKTDTTMTVGVGAEQGELADSLYVVYFTAMDDGIPPKTGMDSLFIMVNDSVANPPPVFTQREVVDRSGEVQTYTQSSVQFNPDSLLAYSEGDSLVITFYATDQDSARGGGSNEPLTFTLIDWEDFVRRPTSGLDSLALADTSSILDASGDPRALRVSLRLAYNAADTISTDTVRLVVEVKDASTQVNDTMMFDIANINRPPIWDADTTSMPSDSAFVWAFEPDVLYADSIDEFTPIAVSNGVTDSIYFNQYVYEPDLRIGDPLAQSALQYETTSQLMDVFPGDGLMVVTITSLDTVSYPFPITVKDGYVPDEKTATKNLVLRVAPEPDIAEIYPASGYPGQDITIFGEGFGLYDRLSSTPSRVVFRARNSSGQAQNIQATVNSWGKDRINLTIPSGVPVSTYIPATGDFIADSIQVYSAVFGDPTVYPYIITEPDTTTVTNLEAVNITSTTARIKWKTAFIGTDSVIVATSDDTLDVFTDQFPDVAATTYWPTFIIPGTIGNTPPTKSTVQVFRGATSTTDEVHYVELTDLTPGVTYQFVIAMENKLFFGDTTRNINGPYNPVKIDRTNSDPPEVNANVRGLLFQTLPAQNSQGETYAIQGNVYISSGAAIGALVTVLIVDADNVADTSLPLTAVVGNDSSWVLNLGNAVKDTLGVDDRTFVHEAGDYLLMTIEGDKDVGYTQFVTTRGTSTPQAINLNEGGTLLVPSVDYDLRLKVGLNLVGIPVRLFATQPQWAYGLLNKVTQGIPSISRWDPGSGTQQTITRTATGTFVGAQDWRLADDDGNYYEGYFIAVGGQEYITLSGSLYGTELPPKVFPENALYWIARPAQIDSLFYAWSARTMLTNIANASEIFRYNEDTQGYESAVVDQTTGAIIYNADFHIDVSEGYILRVTAASQWDINTPVQTQLANAQAKLDNVSGVTPSLTLNTSESNIGSGAVRNVRLSDVSSSAALVSWVTNGSVTTQIRYGKVSDGLNKVAVFKQDASSVAMGSLHLLGLEPETEYAFEIVSNGITYNNSGSPYTFKTARIGTGFPYTLYGRMANESGEPLENTLIYVELKRGEVISTAIADMTDENGYWNVNLANLKMADGEVYQWKAGDEIRVTALYGDASTSFRTLVTGESPQNIIRVSDLDGVAVQDKQEVAKVALPKAFAMGQNYPNPFNPSTTIAYDVPDNEIHGVKVDLNVYNIRGQVVRKLVDNAVKEPGHYVVQWNGKNDNGDAVSSGVYFYRIKAGNFVATRKMVLLK